MAADHKAKLQEYLAEAREAMIWKLDGLGEYDVRRPLTPTGTNLLGLVKHLSIVEAGYFGETFGRPFTPRLTWWDDDAPEGVDMWAAAEEGRDAIVGTYRRAIAHADATIDALDLDAPGRVPWWGDTHVTLHTMLVHVLAETARHAGHADILREGLDGMAGVRAGNSNLPAYDAGQWAGYRGLVEAAARGAAERVTPDVGVGE